MRYLLVQQREDRARNPLASARGHSRPRVPVRRMRAGSGGPRPRLKHGYAGRPPHATVPMFRPCLAVLLLSTLCAQSILPPPPAPPGNPTTPDKVLLGKALFWD